MTRITLRSRGAPVRNPLPSLYSGLCCTPVHSAVHLYSTPGAPGLRYHSQSPLVAISRTRSMPRSHLTGSQAAVAGAQWLHRVPVIMELRPCPCCLYLCRLGALSLCSQLSLGWMQKQALDARVLRVCHVKCHYCHYVSRYENIHLLRYMLQRINVWRNLLIASISCCTTWLNDFDKTKDSPLSGPVVKVDFLDPNPMLPFE